MTDTVIDLAAARARKSTQKAAPEYHNHPPPFDILPEGFEFGCSFYMISDLVARYDELMTGARSTTALVELARFLRVIFAIRRDFPNEVPHSDPTDASHVENLSMEIASLETIIEAERLAKGEALPASMIKDRKVIWFYLMSMSKMVLADRWYQKLACWTL